jgi:dihydrofolate reductase
MIVTIIAAKSENGVIGYENKIPWPFLKDDLAYFKTVTMDCPMIMGRKTFQSLPGILPGRKHIIITSNSAYLGKHQNDPRVKAVSTIEEALSYCENQLGATQCYIIGGGQIYNTVLQQNLAHHAIITEVEIHAKGDVFFPQLGPKWRKDFYIDKVDIKSGIKFKIVYLTKR